MTSRVVHGSVLLAMSLAAVGAVASAEQGQSSAAADPTGGTGVLQSEVYVAAPAGRLGVEIRNGRISPETNVVQTSAPTAVRVDAIALEAPVIPVGVDETLQLDVPDATTVGWYRHGAIPGAPGASVLAAHVDYGGAPGAFFNLSQLQPGDQVKVVLDDGSILPYEVISVSQYDKTELPSEELFRKDGEPVLQLITCGGTFDPERQSYQANVVVTAVPVNDNLTT